jgi:hypothetical protein
MNDTNCEQLSPKAKEIFKKLEPFFPPDPWKKPCWEEEGVVTHNGRYDLRKAADRKKLEDWNKSFVGYILVLQASMYRDSHGGLLIGFDREHITPHMQNVAELLLILQDLDFQIETGDLMD